MAFSKTNKNSVLLLGAITSASHLLLFITLSKISPYASLRGGYYSEVDFGLRDIFMGTNIY